MNFKKFNFKEIRCTSCNSTMHSMIFDCSSIYHKLKKIIPNVSENKLRQSIRYSHPIMRAEECNIPLLFMVIIDDICFKYYYSFYENDKRISISNSFFKNPNIGLTELWVDKKIIFSCPLITFKLSDDLNKSLNDNYKKIIKLSLF